MLHRCRHATLMPHANHLTKSLTVNTNYRQNTSKYLVPQSTNLVMQYVCQYCMKLSSIATDPTAVFQTHLFKMRFCICNRQTNEILTCWSLDIHCWSWRVMADTQPEQTTTTAWTCNYSATFPPGSGINPHETARYGEIASAILNFFVCCMEMG